MNNIIKTVNLSKSFFLKKNLNILKKINIEIKKGELVALLGPSGSGKSTLLHILALLDQPTNGEIYFEGKRTSQMNEFEKDEIRGKKISMIYQQNNLLNDFTSLENVMMSMIASGQDKYYASKEAKKILIKVGLSKRLDHFPTEMSVGEQQRVAIARAIAMKPELILADEPTGNLDTENSVMISNILFQYVKEEGSSLIMVTHDSKLANKAKRKIKIKDGKIK